MAGINNYTTGIQVLNTMPCDADIREEALKRFKMDLNISTSMLYISQETASRTEAKAREEARMAEERARMEAETALKVEAARLEAEKKAKSHKETIMAEERVRIKAEVTNTKNVTAIANKILVEFSAEDWEAIEEFCYNNEIFFTKK